MEKKPVIPMTPFDELVTSPQLQAIKLLLPYAPVSEQRLLASFIKFQEFRQTIRPPPSQQEILSSLKPYLGPQESGTLEMLMNMKDIMDMAEMMRGVSEDGGPPADPMDLLMGMLSPEQKEMFSTYNDMFSQAADNARKGDDNSERMDEQPGTEEYRSGETN